MALAGLLATGAFLLAWIPLLGGSPLGWAGLLVLLVWAVGIGARKAGFSSLGFVAVVMLAVADALQGRHLIGAGAVALALAAWDVALLLVKLPKGNGETAPRVVRAQATRALAVAALGTAVAAGFSFLHLSVPFWGLMGMMVATWATLVALFKLSARLYSEDGGAASGNRSSSGPIK